MITIHQRYRQTDGQTDDMRSQYRALHLSASRGKNKMMFMSLCQLLFARGRYEHEYFLSALADLLSLNFFTLKQCILFAFITKIL